MNSDKNMTVSSTGDEADRKAWMGLLATADIRLLSELWQGYGHDPDHTWLRPPEVGGVMVRGRMGASGAPFNLGEMTVTRCALTLPDGTVGHGYVQGRSKGQAETAAKVDALMQTDAAEDVRRQILSPLEAVKQARKMSRAAKAAATKVDFFTMVRGED
ncbi:phosphonate C-P lyase system protein PhnG [Phaeobacter gallaeciensis]|uniref:phosphonate C-P lyase system protein PhnG n=1 Tax=Phaeobacter gallaeciensis TaxID=60890 RepID=UPI000BBC42BB|nr:phosphonate C-P lyase system protein PhnG [Phaeobacter gallaeciensis]ATF19546.1 phosphonate C-P lyase system protein PhnG [Phaeobacter gallaeciensis]ATF23655.1 phosphonate C-P lyase system protein PhnG [Phaeobacter gallaeciensis]